MVLRRLKLYQRDNNKLKIESRVEGGFGSDNGSDEDGKNGTGGG